MKTISSYYKSCFSIFLLFFCSLISGQYLSSPINPSSRTLNLSLPVGTTSDNLEITSKGSARYEIPIFISPGTAGMQPNISILFNSNVVDGMLGKGFDISGLSTIHRIPQTYYNDNKKVGVNLQSSDRFALDSNRLIVTSGTYGSPGSIYHTEIETFAKITAYGTAGVGPSYFIVETKDGKTLE